jgi:hypothetical protein
MEMFAFFILLPKKFMPYQIQNKIECINDCSYVDAIIEIAHIYMMLSSFLWLHTDNSIKIK